MTKEQIKEKLLAKLDDYWLDLSPEELTIDHVTDLINILTELRRGL